jgi:uncharacterized protein YceK
MYRLFLCVSVALTGCSSLIAHTGEDSQLGKPYSGLEYAIDNAETCDTLMMIGFPPSLLVTIPISVIDIATSTVADTVFLPFDIAVDNPTTPKKSSCDITWK